MNIELIAQALPVAKVVSLRAWIDAVGVTACTAWRWRTYGWLETINIAGRVYVTAEAIQKFVERAKRGEFARAPKVPRRQQEPE